MGEEGTTIETRTRKTKQENQNRIQVRMGSRAVQHFHRRNPSQHRVLASIIDDMNKETRIKNLKMHKSGAGVTHVPIDIEPMDLEQKPASSEEHQSEAEVAQNPKVVRCKDFENVRGGEHNSRRTTVDPGSC